MKCSIGPARSSASTLWHVTRAALALVLSAIVGCTDTPRSVAIATTESQQETDSQQDTVPRATMLALPVGRLVEGLRIDGYEADLVPIEHILVSREGEIVISQPQDRALVQFDARGVRQRSFGAPGSGPGEFIALDYAGWLADSLWVIDAPRGRATIIAPDFEYFRSMSLPASSIYAVTNKGWVARADLDVVVVGDSRVFLDSIPNVVLQRDILTRDYSNLPRYSMSADGARLAMVSAPPIGQLPSHVTVSVTGIDGARVFSRVYPLASATVSPVQWDSIMDAIADGVTDSSPEERAQIRELLRTLPVPPALPPVYDVLFSNDHHVWIRLLDAAGLHYLVLSPEGDPLGRLQLPENSQVRAADGDLIYVVEEDEYGVDSVVRYQVRW